MLKIAICDDEVFYREQIRKYLTKYLDVQNEQYDITLYTAGTQLRELEKNEILQYDLIFLDVNMDELDGIETAQYIRTLSTEIVLVFVTAYISYALEGYKVNAFRYIVKNSDQFEDSFEECMDTFMEKQKVVKKLTFPFIGGDREVYLNCIVFIESQLHKTIFYISNTYRGIKKQEAFYLYEKLDSMEEKLASFGFLRIHQSYIVNISQIEWINDYRVKLYDGTELPVSKSRYKQVKSQYTSYKGDVNQWNTL